MMYLIVSVANGPIKCCCNIKWYLELDDKIPIADEWLPESSLVPWRQSINTCRTRLEKPICEER